MGDQNSDRRKHQRFRFLFMDFRAFWNRIVLNRKAPPQPPTAPRASTPPPSPPALSPAGGPFSTGVKQIDEQHQGIRVAILSLQTDLRNGLVGKSLAERLDSMLQQMDAHFRYEESYMEHISFHGLEDHRAEHQRFRIQVRQLSERAGVRDSTVPLELSSFLLQWFKDHTVQEDSMYSKERRAR